MCSNRSWSIVRLMLSGRLPPTPVQMPQYRLGKWDTELLTRCVLRFRRRRRGSAASPHSTRAFCRPLLPPPRQIALSRPPEDPIRPRPTQTQSDAFLRGSQDRNLSLIHISEPTRRTPISYAVF